MKNIASKLNKLDLHELKSLRDEISREIVIRENESWNSKISIDEVCYDYELSITLKKLGITNMQQLKNNGINSIPSSLVEKTLWTIRTYDFDKLEKKYRKK